MNSPDIQYRRRNGANVLLFIQTHGPVEPSALEFFVELPVFFTLRELGRIDLGNILEALQKADLIEFTDTTPPRLRVTQRVEQLESALEVRIADMVHLGDEDESPGGGPEIQVVGDDDGHKSGV